MKTGVYLITCRVTGERYVGSAKNIHKRWVEHRYDLKNNVHPNGKMQKAWHKHGLESFEWAVLEETPLEESIIRGREQYWIDILHPELNGSEIAGWCKPIGMEVTAEHRKHLSEGLKKTWASVSPERRKEWSRGIRAASAKRKGTAKPRKHIRVHVPRELAHQHMHDGRMRYLESTGYVPKPKRVRTRRPNRTPEEQAAWEAGRGQREQERREKLSKTFKGRPITEEQKQKIRESVLRRWQDPEYRARHQQATIQAMQNPDVIERLRVAHQGKRLPEAQKQKIRESNLGRKRSPETRRRLSEARKRMWAEKRATGEDKLIRQKISNTRRGQKRRVY